MLLEGYEMGGRHHLTAVLEARQVVPSYMSAGEGKATLCRLSLTVMTIMTMPQAKCESLPLCLKLCAGLLDSVSETRSGSVAMTEISPIDPRGMVDYLGDVDEETKSKAAKTIHAGRNPQYK